MGWTEIRGNYFKFLFSTKVIILVTMSENEYGLGQSSDIYRRFVSVCVHGLLSVDNGKTFENITGNIGEQIFIKREHGLQTRQNQHKIRKVSVLVVGR